MLKSCYTSIVADPSPAAKTWFINFIRIVFSMFSSIVHPHPAVRRESSNRIGWGQQKWSVFGVLGAGYPKGCQMFRLEPFCGSPTGVTTLGEATFLAALAGGAHGAKSRHLAELSSVGTKHQKWEGKKVRVRLTLLITPFLYSFVHSLPFIHAGVKISTNDTKRNECRHQLLILRHCWRFWKTLPMELWGLYESISFKSFNIHLNI